ncbi:MAG TPA: hypothetical protein VK638_23730 [Edaphobacter sp.]|nr:hypothetical protein [Edaphobacter sp.]
MRKQNDHSDLALPRRAERSVVLPFSRFVDAVQTYKTAFVFKDQRCSSNEMPSCFCWFCRFLASSQSYRIADIRKGPRLVSIHAPRAWGATTSTLVPSVSMLTFQSTLPAWGATRLEDSGMTIADVDIGLS